jgi:Fur family peroxide stress response transcriptional regulator
LINKNYYYIVNTKKKNETRADEQELFNQRSRKHGLRVTPQRTLIYQELLKSKNHPTADDIYKRVVKKAPNISFDTVNRTLLTFAKVGLTNVVEGYGQAKRYDPDLGVHHHFRCLRCGRIIDFHNKAYDGLPVPEEIGRRFTVLSHKVVLEGLCGKCRKA